MSTNPDDLPQLQRALNALQQMRARLDEVERARVEPLAVVGLGCRFPGGATTPDAFWRLLVEGRDGITEVPPDRWDADAHYDPEVEAAGKLATRWGGFVDGVDLFDPGFFGIAPREAAQMDPQQRLLLEVAWEALESAGETRERLAGSATGVFVGVHSHSSDYGWLQMRSLEDVGTYTSTGTAHSIVANRLSYWLDLRGPSLAVDTACSSSLVAVHLAVRSLRARECDLALAAGVNLLLTPEVTAALSRMRMMAADGRCKTFDAAADGFVRGEGCGVVVLKRLSDALADGDPVLALVAGSAVSQDGATNGLTAPSGLAQREVVLRALADARIEPAQVGFVETHGTGTALGDPIEVEALAEALGRAGGSPCLLGAVKSNLGHLEGAAGIAGLIKAILALRHRTIPPNLHFRELNPHISLAGTRFEIPTSARPWPESGFRCAGVSSFGFGGTNAHVVLREAPAPAGPPPAAEAPAGGPAAYLLPLSAHTPAALRTLAGGYVELLGGDAPALADLCYTASLRRTHHPHRLAVVGRTVEELAASLGGFLAGDDLPDARHGYADPEARRRLVWVFSGQGSQRPGMAASLLAREPVFRAAVEACDRLLRPLAGWSLIDELVAPAGRSRLDDTAVAQASLFAVQVGLAALWRAWGIVPDAVLGHSVGEVAAAHVAGALELEDAVRVIHHRGRVMRPTAGAGRMAAVGLSRAAAESFLAERGGISLAAVNGPGSCVLSGEPAAVDAALAELAERGVFARLLPVTLAAHSPRMEAPREELVRALAGLRSRPPAIPLVSTVTGRPVRDGELDAGYWGRNLREPVLFAPAVEEAVRVGPADFLELGPHPLVRTPLEQCVGASDALVVSSLAAEADDRTALLQSLGALHAHGHRVAWEALHPAGGQVVPLPAFPWQRSRFWIETPAAERRPVPVPPERGDAAPGDLVLPGRPLSSPAIAGSVYESVLTEESLRFLGEHRLDGRSVVPAAFFVELLLSAGRAALGQAALTARDLAIVHPLALDDAGRRVQSIVHPAADGGASWELHSRPADGSAGWVLHATGRVAEADTAAPADGAGVGLAPGEAPARLHLSPGAGAQPEGLRRVAVLDACFRLGAAIDDGGAGPRDGFVVASVGAVRLDADAHGELYCHVRTEPDGDDGGFTATILLVDPAGEVVGRADGVRYARIRGAAPSAADEPWTDWCFGVQWRPRAPLAGRLPWAGPLGVDPASLAERLGAAQEGRTSGDGAPADGVEVAASGLAAELDGASAAYVVRALRRLGLDLRPGEVISPESLADRLALPPHHRRLLLRMVGMLEEDGILTRTASTWNVLREPAPAEPDTLVDGMAARFRAHAAELQTFRRCAGQLAEVLLSRRDPLQLLFPDGSQETTQRLYGDAPLSRAPNELVARLLDSLLRALPEDRVLRVLEIGGGTGGTTSQLLPLLPPERTDYVFTDVSPAFVERGRERFRAYPFVRFETLDIEAEPEAQGFAPGRFDVVLAANVLHATADLRAALRRVRRLLAPSGLLLLLEGVRPARWIDLVFGLTEGWWKFGDVELRPSHPLLEAERWAALLPEVGFGQPQLLRPPDPAAETTFEQAVIVAQAEASAVEPAAAAAPEPAAGEPARAPARYLVFADDDATTARLAERIEAPGMECELVVRPGRTGAPEAGDRGPEEGVPEEVEARVRRWLAEAAGRAGAVIHLAGGDDGPADESSAEVAARVEAECLAVAGTARALLDSPAEARLWVVTRGAQPVAGGGADPRQAALWGLGRSLALEAPERWGGLIDLDAHSDAGAAAGAVLEQLGAGDGEDQVAYRGGCRYVARLAPLSDVEPAQPLLRRDAAYLVTGGLGALGLELARWLAERGAGRLVLTGRRGLPERDAWTALPAGSPEARQAAAVLEIEALGAAVTPVAADVCDSAAMERLFGRFGGELPELRGIFHVAAVMEFATLPRLDGAALSRVVRPKVAGSWELHRRSRDLQLDHFVLFSSVAGLWGSRGMAHYAAANQFLAALAHHRRAAGLPALVVDWGAWAGGDADRAANRFVAQSDFRLMPPRAALAALGAALAAGVAQRAVAWVDWGSLRANYELHSGRRFLQEIDPGDDVPRAETPSAAPPSTSLVQRLRASAEDEARALLTATVRGEVATVLGLDATRLLEPGQGFFKLGMDSLMTVELRARLERGLGLKLPTTIAFEYPTVEALSGYLAGVVRAPAEAPREPAAAPTPTPAPAAAEIETLSEDELAAMLDVAISDLLDDEAPTR